MPGGQPPVLIVFSGLPGTGKTTVSRALAERISAVWLRIDAIEVAMREAGAERIGPAGYAVANALALANLRLGHSIVADCVNPVRESRQGWADVARSAPARLVDIHLVCSDPEEHRRRVEQRAADLPGHVLPDWDAVMARTFDPVEHDPLILDTATLSPAKLVDRCAAHVANSSVRTHPTPSQGRSQPCTAGSPAATPPAAGSTRAAPG